MFLDTCSGLCAPSRALLRSRCADRATGAVPPTKGAPALGEKRSTTPGPDPESRILENERVVAPDGLSCRTRQLNLILDSPGQGQAQKPAIISGKIPDRISGTDIRCADRAKGVAPPT